MQVRTWTARYRDRAQVHSAAVAPPPCADAYEETSEKLSTDDRQPTQRGLPTPQTILRSRTTHGPTDELSPTITLHGGELKTCVLRGPVVRIGGTARYCAMQFIPTPSQRPMACSQPSHANRDFMAPRAYPTPHEPYRSRPTSRLPVMSTSAWV